MTRDKEVRDCVNSLCRELFGLPPADPEDIRPAINFDDPEQLKREDLTPQERGAVKNSTFMARYGSAESIFPAVNEMRGTSTGRNPSDPALQDFPVTRATEEGPGLSAHALEFTPLEAGKGLSLSEEMEHTSQAIADSTGSYDFQRIELRVAAQLLREPEGTAEDPIRNARNFAVQAEASGRMMLERAEDIKRKLRDLAAKYGLNVTGLEDGEQIGVSFPEGTPMEQQLAIAKELGGIAIEPKEAEPSLERATTRASFHRISATLAYHLRQRDVRVCAGDMLGWFPIGIGAFREPGAAVIGPIPLAWLPPKVQKIALRAK